jgi:hypothetical protein
MVLFSRKLKFVLPIQIIRVIHGGFNSILFKIRPDKMKILVVVVVVVVVVFVVVVGFLVVVLGGALVVAVEL